jgi:hypothetical protein
MGYELTAAYIDDVAFEKLSDNVGADAAAAIAAARSGNGQIAALILPADTAWDEEGLVGSKIRHGRHRKYRRK